MAASVGGSIEIVIQQNKLEAEIEKLNALGYTVMQSEKTDQDGMIKLFAQKLFFNRCDDGK